MATVLRMLASAYQSVAEGHCGWKRERHPLVSRNPWSFLQPAYPPPQICLFVILCPT
jgi:hypothetical protein